MCGWLAGWRSVIVAWGAEERPKVKQSKQKPTAVCRGDLYVSGWKGGEGMVWRAKGIDAYALAGKVRLHAFLGGATVLFWRVRGLRS